MRTKYCLAMILSLMTATLFAADEPASRIYQNRLKRLENPPPLLADYPEYIEPIEEEARFEGPLLVNDAEADLSVRAWRFSYNARGIIEMPNRLQASATAIIMVHPWGIDDENGWKTPEPAGCADFCTPRKNHLAARHTKRVIDPFLQSLRSKVACVMYSLPGAEDPIRKKAYRSLRAKPTEAERTQGLKELKAKLDGFNYTGEPLPSELTLSAKTPVVDYFRQFPGLDAGAKFNRAGFWDLPIPVSTSVTVDADDIVIYDSEGYESLKKFLQDQGIRHVLLTGYCTDMCFARTTAGYENLRKDFNVFLVGDATLATFPSNATPRFATNASISFAALQNLVTQVSWIKHDEQK
ncbi:MAG TPA: isochorismatase family protein [Planctomycetaceae bacterium]|nr:isochorismatase family protein [Planctomycetaceae bacterium]